MALLTKAQLDAWVSPQDGVLPDGSMEEVTLEDWQRFLDLVHREGWALWWRRDAEHEEVPHLAEVLLAGDAATLALNVGTGVQVNVFPP